MGKSIPCFWAPIACNHHPCERITEVKNDKPSANYLSLKEAAWAVDYNPNYFGQLVVRGYGPPFQKYGANRYFLLEDVKAWAKNRRKNIKNEKSQRFAKVAQILREQPGTAFPPLKLEAGSLNCVGTPAPPVKITEEPSYAVGLLFIGVIATVVGILLVLCAH
jgi:hypothetical protein